MYNLGFRDSKDLGISASGLGVSRNPKLSEVDAYLGRLAYPKLPQFIHGPSTNVGICNAFACTLWVYVGQDR